MIRLKFNSFNNSLPTLESIPIGTVFTFNMKVVQGTCDWICNNSHLYMKILNTTIDEINEISVVRLNTGRSFKFSSTSSLVPSTIFVKPEGNFIEISEPYSY